VLRGDWVGASIWDGTNGTGGTDETGGMREKVEGWGLMTKDNRQKTEGWEDS